MNSGVRSKTHQLSVLRDPSCTECRLGRLTTGSVCVLGRGSNSAKVMLIGEAPGAAEAKTGKPFMGASGKELNKILVDLGMLDKVYITNICRCRPPGNRVPKIDEREVCDRLFLTSEVRIVDCTSIVLLGRTPSFHFLGKAYEKGTPYFRNYAGKARMFIPTWHPAAFLYSGNKRILMDIVDAISKAAGWA